MADAVVKVQNVNSWLITTDTDLKDKLYRGMRARPKNYFHNVAYKKKRWDGWDKFFDKKTGMFMTGLLYDVELALNFLKKPYKLIDERSPIDFVHQTIDDQFLNKWLPAGTDPITLRDFQPDLVNQAFKYKRGIVRAPCGAGKTFILISLIKSLPPKTPTLFLTDNKSLVHQNWEQMEKWGVENLGRWYGDFKELNYVTCATIHPKTFESLKKVLPKIKAVFVDEVHDCVSEVPLSAYRQMTNATVRIGFSATPFKYLLKSEDKEQIDKVHKFTVKGHFGPVFKTTTTKTGYITTKDLQERGMLSSSYGQFYPITEPDLQYEIYQDAVKLGIEQNFYFHNVVKRLARSCPGRTLVIVERIEQGEYLKQLMPEAHWLQGKNSLKERQPVINALKAGEKTIAIVMRHLITAGIDIKIHDFINASGGDAAHNLIQQMGRGLRPADDKGVLNYHDFLFYINEYLYRHSNHRINCLRSEGHEVVVKESIDF